MIQVLSPLLLERISSYLPQEDYINLACVSRLFASLYQYHDADYWWSHFSCQVRMKYRTPREMRLVSKFCMYANKSIGYIPKELKNIASLWWRQHTMYYWVPFGEALIKNNTNTDNIELLITIMANPNKIKLFLQKEYILYCLYTPECMILYSYYDKQDTITDRSYQEIIYDTDIDKWNMHPSNQSEKMWLSSYLIKRYIEWSYLRIKTQSVCL